MAEMQPRNISDNPFSPLGSGRPTTRSPVLRRKLLTVGTCFGCACGVSLTAVIGAMVWFAVHHSIRRQNPNDTNLSFCCSQEAAKLFAVIDKNEPPCKNFYGYVCKKAVEQGFVKLDVMSDVMSDITGDIIKGTNNYGSEAAAALHSLYTSCIQEIWQQETLIRDVTAAVLEIANVTRRMSGADLLRLAVAVNRRYGLTFAFEIRTSASVATQLTFIRRNYRPRDYWESCDASCYVHAFSILNGHFGTNYTEQDIENWEERFLVTHSRYSPMSWTEIREVFGGLEAAQLKAIFLELFIDVDSIKTLNVVSKASFLRDIRRLTNESNQPLSVFYKVVLLVLDAMRYIQDGKRLNSPTLSSEMICNNHVYYRAQLWRVAYVTALATPTKDDQLHNIFEATRKMISNYALYRKLMAAGNDTERFLAVMKNFSLMLPGDLIFREPAVPLMSKQGFVRNLFLALNYEFASEMQKARRGMPPLRDDAKVEMKQRMFFINETTLYVSSLGYGWLSSGTTDPMLTDATVFVPSLAVLLSENILNRNVWSERTKVALNYYRKCLTITSGSTVYDLPLPVVDAYKHGMRVAALVGAAGTGTAETNTPASARPSWYTVQHAWSLFRMSEAQFFYARVAYYHCDSFPDVLLNEIFKDNADFSIAFQCPRTNDKEKKDCTNFIAQNSDLNIV